MSVLSKKSNNAHLPLILGLAFVFFPFIILGIFNHPCVDDFAYANKTLRLGFWQTQVNWYMGWGGRYFTTLLLSINPLVIHSFLLYKFIPLVLLMALFHSLYQLLGELTGHYFGKVKTALATLVLLALYVDKMPGVSQGFYWFTGAVTYQTGNILTLYLLTCLIRQQRAQSLKQAVLYAALVFILIPAVIGSNEITMVIFFSLLCAVMMVSLYADRKVNWIFFAFMVAAVIAVYFTVMAPGNTVRLARDFPQKQNALLAIKSSLEEPVKSIFHWAVTLPFAVLTIFSIPFIAPLAEKRIKNKKHLFIHPLFSWAVYMGALAAAYLPGYWSMGGIPPARGMDVIFLLFLLGWFFNVYILVEYGIRKYGWTFSFLPKYQVIVLCGFAFLNFFKEDSHVRTAYSDLLTGRAARYDQALKNRYQSFTDNNTETYEVSPLQKPPETIFFDDITTDARDWRNTSYAKYFHKKIIILRKQDHEGPPPTVIHD